MTSHDAFQHDLPAYIAARLEGESLLRLEEHLQVCDDCREMASTWRGLVAAMRAGGEALFEPHPGETDLRDFSLGGGGDARDRIERHLEGCASCELEVSAWRRRKSPALVPESAPRLVRHGFWIPSVAAAGGLALGIGLMVFLAESRQVPDEAPSIGEQVGHLILPASPLRGVETTRPYTLRSGQRHVEVGFRPSLSRGASDLEQYRFEVRRESGETIWSMEMTVAELREILTLDEMVAFSFPTSVIGPGRYEFRTIPPGTAGEAGAQRVLVEILPPR